MTIKNKLLKLVFFVVIPLYAGYLQYRVLMLEDVFFKYERILDEMTIVYEDKMQDYNEAIIEENKALRLLVSAVSREDYSETEKVKADLVNANNKVQQKNKELDNAFVDFKKLIETLGLH